MDTQNKADLQKSLAEWTAKLRASTKRVGVLRGLLTAAQARRQKAQWVVKRRKAQLAHIKAGPGKRVVNAAVSHVGDKEQPAGSNRGPGVVSLCQKTIIGYAGVAWCGCFVGYILKTVLGLPVVAGIAYTPNILAYAKAGTNGFKSVVAKDKGQPGDVLTFDWNRDGVADHTAFVIENLGGGNYKTVEGNTSFDNAGSQSNGGCVAVRTRYAADILGIARPDYAKATK